MVPHLLQVSITGTNTPQQLTTTNTKAYQIVFQNNDAHDMRIGDSTVTSTKGIVLVAGGGAGNSETRVLQDTDLSDWWVNGTADEKLDILYLANS